MSPPRDFVELLAFGAHPDDVELACGGLLLLMARRGYRFAIIDLTGGERGSRGDADTRAQEAKNAAAQLGAAGRECLGLPDTQLEATHGAVRIATEAIRRWRPKLVLCHDAGDQHPDHAAAARIVHAAAFQAGLHKAVADGEPHRVRRVVRYSRHTHFRPSFVVDISDVVEEKLHAVRCYASQFDPAREGPTTPLTDAGFEDDLRAFWRFHGKQVGALYAEPYAMDGPPALSDPVKDLCEERREF